MKTLFLKQFGFLECHDEKMIRFVSLTKQLLFPMVDMLLQNIWAIYVSDLFISFLKMVVVSYCIAGIVHLQTFCNSCNHEELRKYCLIIVWPKCYRNLNGLGQSLRCACCDFLSDPCVDIDSIPIYKNVLLVVAHSL